MVKKLLGFLLLLIIISSCKTETDEINEVEGYKPIYLDRETATNVYVSGPEELKNPGKIYIWNDYIFLSETGKGVHIIDNSDPENPQKIKFIHIPGNKDIAVKSNYLYADNILDLVVLNITDMNKIAVVKRIKDAYPQRTQFYPEFISGHYFECVDTTKGLVVDWEKTMLTDPKCYR